MDSLGIFRSSLMTMTASYPRLPAHRPIRPSSKPLEKRDTGKSARAQRTRRPWLVGHAPSGRDLPPPTRLVDGTGMQNDSRLNSLSCWSLEELSSREDSPELLCERVGVAGGLCGRGEEDARVLVVPSRARDRSDASLVVKVELLSVGRILLVFVVSVGPGRGRGRGSRR